MRGTPVFRPCADNPYVTGSVGGGGVAVPYSPPAVRSTLRDPAPALPRTRFPGDGDALVRRLGELSRIDRTPIYLAFLLYIFITTSYRLPIGTLAMAAALGALFFQKVPFRTVPAVNWAAPFLVWCSIGVVTTRYTAMVQEQVVLLFKIWLIAIVAANALRTRSQIRGFILFFLLCFALFPARGTIVNYFFVGYREFGRAVWLPGTIFGNPNDVGVLCLLQLSMAAGVFVTEKNKWFRIGALAAMLVLPVVTLITGSRAVFIATSVFGVLAVLGHRKRVRAITFGVVAMLAAAPFVPPELWERLSTIRQLAGGTAALEQLEDDGSAAERFQIWETAFLIIKDNPVVGVGFGAYGPVNAIYSPIVTGTARGLGAKDTHSTYFNVLAETGYPGLVLFLGMIIATIIPAERSRRACKNDMPGAATQLLYLELGLLGYLIAGIWGSFPRIPFLYVHLVLIGVTALACDNDLKVYRSGRGPASHGAS